MAPSPSPLSIALASPYTPPELRCIIPTQDTHLIDSPEPPRAMHLRPRVLRRYGRAGCYLTPVSPASPSPAPNKGALGFATQLEQLWPTTDNASTFVRSQVAACSDDSNGVETGRASNSVSMMVECKHSAAFIPLPVPAIEPLQMFVSPALISQGSDTHNPGHAGEPTMTTPELSFAPHFDNTKNDGLKDVFSNFRSRPEADIMQLNALDSKLAIGLKAHEFWALFSKCALCHLFVTSRSIEDHQIDQCHRHVGE